MSIFPFIDQSEVIPDNEELPMAREWAWDFEKDDFKKKNGQMYIVEGNEAIKIWLWKLFQTPRYRHLIYTWNYGHELEPLIGKSYSRSLVVAETKRLVKEAVYYALGDYVTEIKNLEVDFYKDILNISFTALTPYGEVEISV